jgi:hypothetical protein
MSPTGVTFGSVHRSPAALIAAGGRKTALHNELGRQDGGPVLLDAHGRPTVNICLLECLIGTARVVEEYPERLRRVNLVIPEDR